MNEETVTMDAETIKNKLYNIIYNLFVANHTLKADNIINHDLKDDATKKVKQAMRDKVTASERLGLQGYFGELNELSIEIANNLDKKIEEIEKLKRENTALNERLTALNNARVDGGKNKEEIEKKQRDIAELLSKETKYEDLRGDNEMIFKYTGDDLGEFIKKLNQHGINAVAKEESLLFGTKIVINKLEFRDFSQFLFFDKICRPYDKQPQKVNNKQVMPEVMPFS